jgi:hypothetical protein
MDAEFERRWRARLHPFNGIILRHEALVPLPALRQALTAVVDCLQQRCGTASLWTLRDWHEHDGYVATPRETGWPELWSILASDKALSAAQAGDTYVRIAFFPEDRNFYLRFYIPDENELPDDVTGWHGMFDITGDPALADYLEAAIRAAALDPLIRESAADYFDRTYSG